MNWYAYCGNNPLAFVDPTGMIIEATGRIMVTPGALSPSTIKGGVIVDIMSIYSLIDAGLRSMAVSQVFSILSVVPFVTSSSTGWHAYIEVIDHNDTNGDGVIDEKDLSEGQTFEDLKSAPYWVEIGDILAHADKNAGAQYNNVAGYFDSDECRGWRAALNAARIVASAYMPETRLQPSDLVKFEAHGDYEGPIIFNPTYASDSVWLRRALLNYGMDDAQKLKDEQGCTCPPFKISHTCPIHGTTQ
jgi:hypothetical protein